MTGFKVVRWFLSLLRPPVKEPTLCELAQEVAELRKLVDSLCVHTQPEMADGTPEHSARLRLAGKARYRGFRLMLDEAARAQLAELEGKKKELLEDFPALRTEA